MYHAESAEYSAHVIHHASTYQIRDDKLEPLMAPLLYNEEEVVFGISAKVKQHMSNVALHALFKPSTI